MAAASANLCYGNNNYNNNNNNCDISIANFYVNCNVFVTGATGFVGKTLLEKLLRCCKGIDKIYLLMRTKKGINIRDRLRQLLESAVSVILLRKRIIRFRFLSIPFLFFSFLFFYMASFHFVSFSFNFLSLIFLLR